MPPLPRANPPALPDNNPGDPNSRPGVPNFTTDSPMAGTGTELASSTPRALPDGVVLARQEVISRADGVIEISVTYEVHPQTPQTTGAPAPTGPGYWPYPQFNQRIVNLPGMAYAIPDYQIHASQNYITATPNYITGTQWNNNINLTNSWFQNSGTQYPQHYLNPCTCAGADTCDTCIAAQRTRERARIRAERDRRDQARATKRGRKLLLRCLSEEQQHEYARTRMITVEAADGRLFRLRKQRTVELLGADGVPEASYCIHLSGGFIPEDTLLAQKLLLETDPAEFERIANITRLTRRDPITPEQHQRYLNEYYRDSRAMLRAEGIADPDQWIDDVRRQARMLNQGSVFRRAEGSVFRPGEGSGARGVAAQAIIEEVLFEADLAGDRVNQALALADRARAA